MIPVKANELRLGNKIWWLHEEAEQVLTVDAKMLATIDDYNKFPEKEEYSSRGMWYAAIPLSPEILEVNCKFASSFTTDPQELGASKVYKKEGIEIHQPKENVNYFFVVRQSDEWFIELKTLHQLQNYYFAITAGLELPFTH